MTCQVELLRYQDGLTSLQEEWEQLLAESESTVFQTYDWISTWWNHHKDGRELRMFVFRASGLLVGLAPFFLERRRFPLPVRHLKYLGSPLADYQHIICRRGYEGVVLHDWCQYLAEHSHEWDVLDIDSVNEDSGGLAVLREALKDHQLSEILYQCSVSARLQLPASFEEYLQSRDKHWRHEYRRKSKALAKLEGLTEEEFNEPGPALRSAMGSFFEIHGARWKSLGYPSAFDKKDLQAFYTEVADKFAARHMLRLWFLTIKGTRIAFTLDLVYGDTVNVLHSQAVGPEDVMKCSPGFLIKMRAIERAIAEGYSFYDLLRGEHEYKYRDFAAAPSKNWMVRITSGGRAGRTRFAFFLLREFAGKTLDRAKREYYESRRYRLTRDKSPFGLIRYTVGRIGALARIAGGYFSRHRETGSSKEHHVPPAER